MANATRAGQPRARHRGRGHLAGLLIALATLVLAPAVTGDAGVSGLAHHVDHQTRLAATGPGPEPDASTGPGPSHPPATEPPVPTGGPATEPPASTEPPATEPPASTEPTVPPNQPTPILQPPSVRPERPGPVLGVNITSEDLTLTPAYWNAHRTVVELRVTVANTGEVQESIRLGYTLPAGLTDAGTRGCARSDGSYLCAPWAVPAGTRFSTRLRIEVHRDAWRMMPLSGQLRATATATAHHELPAVTDEQGFALLFPSGPPAAGISLDASEVSFDISGRPATLGLRLGNTGPVDSSGTLEVILPAGVAIPAPPASCQPTSTGRTRCDLGTIPAGTTNELRLTVSASAEAQRMAPLSGAARATLTPVSGAARQVQMSFRITAAAATAPMLSSDGVSPTASQGVLLGGAGDTGGRVTDDVRLTAIALVVVSILLVLLASGLAMFSLRRRAENGSPLPGQARVRPDSSSPG